MCEAYVPGTIYGRVIHMEEKYIRLLYKICRRKGYPHDFYTLAAACVMVLRPADVTPTQRKEAKLAIFYWAYRTIMPEEQVRQS